MIRVQYDSNSNAVIIEFLGHVSAAEGEHFFPDVKKAVPSHGRGFKVLTDLSGVQTLDPEIQASVKRAMDYLNAHGVTEVIRVIPDPNQDIGFNIMGLFHYSKDVQSITVPSREEAEARF